MENPETGNIGYTRRRKTRNSDRNLNFGCLRSTSWIAWSPRSVCLTDDSWYVCNVVILTSLTTFTGPLHRVHSRCYTWNRKCYPSRATEFTSTFCRGRGCSLVLCVCSRWLLFVIVSLFYFLASCLSCYIYFYFLIVCLIYLPPLS